MSLELVLGALLFLVLIIGAGTVMVFKRRRDPSANRDSYVGSRFDSYLVHQFLKRGGIATLYLATDARDKSLVALKIMHEHLMEDRDLITKFLREGDILEVLNRKYPDAPIVRVYRHSRENNAPGGRPFIALELIDGPDLDDLLRRGRSFTHPEAARIIREIAIALSAAHAEHTWHRDVSPGNIMMHMRGNEIAGLTLVDFGVAKHEYLSSHTPDGSIHGKPPYMSPEQCRGQEIDGRSDIYALGILFFTLLEGHPPFMSKNPLEILRMHETVPLPPLSGNVPVQLRSMVERMLRKDRDERFQEMSGFLAELDAAMRTLDIAAFEPDVQESASDDHGGVMGTHMISTPGEVPLLSGARDHPAFRLTAIAVGVVAIVASLLWWLSTAGNVTGIRTVDSSMAVDSPVWLETPVGGSFYGEFAVSSADSAGFCGIAFGTLDRNDYYRVLIFPGGYAYERSQTKVLTRLSQHENGAVRLADENIVSLHVTNGKAYIYINGESGFPVEFVGTGEGSRRVGFVQDKGMKVTYRFNVRQIEE